MVGNLNLDVRAKEFGIYVAVCRSHSRSQTVQRVVDLDEGILAGKVPLSYSGDRCS